MRKTLIGALACALMAAVAATPFAADAGADAASIARGRYVVRIGGCNDCHTPGYPQSGGRVPESDWLTGSPVGFQGPWGTTYPANLRLLAQGMTEAQWMRLARTEMRPPMPWFALRDMQESDLRATYRFIRSLGAKGAPAPGYAAPGEPVTTPYIAFVPQNLPQQNAAR